jgi:hypothetical protein
MQLLLALFALFSWSYAFWELDKLFAGVSVVL